MKKKISWKMVKVTRKKEIDGWILDVATKKSGVTIWLKTTSGISIPIHTTFYPSLYLVPKTHYFRTGNSIFKIEDELGRDEQVNEIKIVQRRVDIHDHHEQPVIQIKASNPGVFKALARKISNLDKFDLYNVDLPISQKFFYETGLFPFARVRVEFFIKDGKVWSDKFTLLDDRKKISYTLPDLKVAWLNVIPEPGRFVHEWRVNTPIRKIIIEPADDMLTRQDKPQQSFARVEIERTGKNDEENVIRSLVSNIKHIDPDVILTRGGDEHVFPYLTARAATLGINARLQLSREKRALSSECFHVGDDSKNAFFSYGQILKRSATQYYLSGRLHVDTTSHGSLHFKDGNIPGMIEVARISSVPIQRLNRITIGGALQSIQFMLAHERGILIPRVKKSAETFKTVNTLLLADRGGHIFEPETGIFENVISLDFTSMYPMIMTRYNVSPETINCSCCDPKENKIPGLDYHVCTRYRGLVPDAIEIPLMKRIKYKQLAKKPGNLGKKAGLMQAALKWILVVSFGYLGFKNARFGRVEAHQAVCAYAREMLLRASSIVKRHGLEMIHGIVDSLWCHDKAGIHDDLEAISRILCAEIERETKLPIESDGIFKFVIFLPSMINSNIGTLNRYWGVFKNGKIKVRGIELRRRDSPPIVKSLQRDVILLLSTARDKNGIFSLVPEAKRILRRYIDDLENGGVDLNSLVFTTRLSREPREYKSLNYQAIASRQLKRAGKQIHAGDDLKFIITNASSKIPNDRVLALELASKRRIRPDKGKYKQLLERAFQNLFPFPIYNRTWKKRQDKEKNESKSLMAWVNHEM
ncbi:MAG: DNA polymerase domain-containing protein [Promethearchaeota archaeon]